MEFTLRKFKSSDMFPMFAILSKIGFKDLKNSLSEESIKNMVSAFNGEDDESKATYVGFSIMLNIAEAVIKNLPSCENEIYNLLSSLSGMTVNEIADLDMVTFTEMIIAVVQKEEFKDFFKVVSGLFK